MRRMAMRVVLSKISPLASSKSSSSSGFIERSQSIRRFFLDDNGYNYKIAKEDEIDLKLEGMSIDEMEKVVKALSPEEVCRVDWDKYSLVKHPVGENKWTKEIDRWILKTMDDEYMKMDGV